MLGGAGAAPGGLNAVHESLGTLSGAGLPGAAPLAGLDAADREWVWRSGGAGPGAPAGGAGFGGGAASTGGAAFGGGPASAGGIAGSGLALGSAGPAPGGLSAVHGSLDTLPGATLWDRTLPEGSLPGATLSDETPSDETWPGAALPSTTLSDGGGTAPAGGSSSPLTVWGTGDYRSLSGGEGAVDWEGDLAGLHVGVDTPLGESLLAGLAASWTEAEFDYRYRGPWREASADVAGTFESRMWSVQPYLNWSHGPDLNVWALAGYGWGEVEVAESGSEFGETGDSRLNLAAAGAVWRLNDSGRFIGGGRTSLDLKTEAWLSGYELESGESRLEGMSADASRVRLGLSAVHERMLASGSLSSSLELSVRHDGGDGRTGYGAELSGGLDYARDRLRLGVRGRTLLAHEDTLEEWGVSGSVEYAPSAEGEGLSVALRSEYGLLAEAAERLWSEGLAGRPSGLAGHSGALGGLGLRTQGEVNYGMRLFEEWSLMPYGGFEQRGGSLEQRMGLRLAPRPELTLELEGRQRAAESAVARTVRLHRLGLRYEWRSGIVLGLEGMHETGGASRPERGVTIQISGRF